MLDGYKEFGNAENGNRGVSLMFNPRKRKRNKYAVVRYGIQKGERIYWAASYYDHEDIATDAFKKKSYNQSMA